MTPPVSTGVKTYAKRSALGKYTVAGGSPITIEGYNLPGTVLNAVDIGGTQIDATGSVSSIDVDTTGITTSGYLTVTTNTVDSINNINNNSLAQNDESDSFYPGRKDDRYVAFWQITANPTYIGRDAVMRPVLDGTGQPTGGVDWMYVYNSDSIYLDAGKMTQSFAVDGGDFRYNANGTRIWTFVNNSRWWGDSNLSDIYTHWGSVQWSAENGFTYNTVTNEHAAYNFNLDNKARFGLGNLVYPSVAAHTEDTSDDGQLDRYENVLIEVNGDDTGTDNFVVYYDNKSINRAIAFLSFTTGTGVTGYGLTDGAPEAGIPLNWNSTIDKIVSDNKAYSSAGNESARDNGLDNPIYNGTTNNVRQNIITGSSASSDFSMKYDADTGYIYLAWYDPNADTLKLMYNATPIATPGAWTTWGTTIDSSAGTHVVMEIDPDSGIHLAYLDITAGYLKYAYITTNAGVPQTKTTVTVDALFASGQHNGITIRDFDTVTGPDYRPVITTFSSAYIGTNAAVRLAYPTTTLAGLANGANTSTGAFTGNWESITVPSQTVQQAVATFAETDGTTVTQGNVIVGYNGSYLEEATYPDLD